MTITRKQAIKEIDQLNSCFFKRRATKVQCHGNTTVNLVNEFIDVAGKWIAKNIPHCKIKFVNSVGNETSNILTSRQPAPCVYRFLKDVFDVEQVQYLPSGVVGMNNVRIALLFLIDNVGKCFWPTAFFDDGVSQDKEVLVNEWLHNREINPYFAELVEQAKALINREQQTEQMYREFVIRNRKAANFAELVAAEIA